MTADGSGHAKSARPDLGQFLEDEEGVSGIVFD
jgi:hypothetical protein